MIIHPDGRLEGTPEELAVYQKTMKTTENFPKAWWDSGYIYTTASPTITGEIKISESSIFK